MLLHLKGTKFMLVSILFATARIPSKLLTATSDANLREDSQLFEGSGVCAAKHFCPSQSISGSLRSSRSCR